MFVNRKSVSVLRGLASFLLQKRLIGFAILSSNCPVFLDFHAKSYIIFFLRFRIFFPSFVSIEMLSRYPNVITKIIVPIGLKETINGS